MDYSSIEEARERGGLRLVLTTGVPGPWGEAAKGVFHAKKVPYLPVAQEAGTDNEALVAWTGYRNAPQAIYEDEAARIGWAEILLLAERLSPDTPSLIPSEARERATMFGLSYEICGEDGLGWSRRLTLFEPMYRAGIEIPDVVKLLSGAYGYSDESVARAHRRCQEIVGLFAERIHAQRDRGSRYLVGEALTAVDIHWACFAAMLKPLPDAVCPMPEAMRASYGYTEPYDPVLLEHRDFIYAEHLPTPLDF